MADTQTLRQAKSDAGKVNDIKIKMIQTFSDLPILVWLANTLDEERM